MRAVLLILALVALVLPGPSAAQIGLPSIKNKLIELALDQISTPGSFEVTAGAIEDSDDGVTSLLDVRISDGEGVWLTLERLNFAWEPKRLLSGELAISRLELIGMTVSRPPSPNAEPPELKPQEPWSKGIFDWPRAPVAVSIEGVRLERVSVAEGVLPQPIRFDAQGHARDMGDLQEIELSLDRTDGVAGRIALSMRRDFAANTVMLDIVASEAAGGLVAATAGLPPDAPARLTLKADGPPEDWRLTFDAGIERVFDAAGTATLAYAERLSVDADFNVVPGPDLGAEMRAILGEQATLRAKVVEQLDGMIEITTAELASPALQLGASGAFATGAGESDLAVKLVALPPLAALADGLAFERLSFEGTVRGPQGMLAAEGALGLSGLRTAAADAGLLAFDGRMAQTPGGLTFDLGGRGEGLRIDRVGPQVIGAAMLTAAGALEGDLLTLTRAALGSPALAVEASGSYDLAAAKGALTASLSAPEIAPVAGAYGAVAKGAVAASAELALAGADVDATVSAELRNFAMDRVSAARLALGGRVGRSAEGLTFDIAGDGARLVLDRVPAELTGALTLALTASLAGGMLVIEGLKLDSPLLSVGASGTVGIEAGTLAVEYAARTAELAPVVAAYGMDATGSLGASGRAEGALDAPRLAGQATIGAAAYGGRDYGTVGLTHDVTVGPAPAGNLNLTTRDGWLGDGEVATGFRLEGSRLTFEGLKAALLGASLAGDAAVDLDATLIEGAFDLAVPDVGRLGRFAGTPLSGAATGQMALTAPAGRQDLAADLTLGKFAAGGASLASADLRLTAADLFGKPRLDARLDAGGVAAGGIELAAVKAQAKGPLAAVDFSAEATGTLRKKPLAASLSGRANAEGEPIRVTLGRAEAAADADTAGLRKPLSLRIGGGTVEATGLDLALPGEASLTGEAAQRPGGLTGDLTLSRLPLALLDRWGIVPVLSGTLDASAAFDTRPGRARAEIGARARAVTFEKTQAVAGGLDLDVDAAWNGLRLETTAELRGDFGAPLRARLALPMRPGAGGIPALPKRGPVEGAVTWAGDIGDLWALVPVVSHVLDGRTAIDLHVGGTLEAPRLSGGVTVANGQYQNLDAGTILTELTLATAIGEDGTVSVALDASDGARGTVSSHAALRLGGGTPSIDMTATLGKAVLIRRDDVTARLSGELALAGPLTDLAARGRIMIDKAEVRLVGGAPSEVVELEGIRIKGEPEPEQRKRVRRTVALDITIEAPDDIFVRGRGLDSEWKMAVTVTGDATQPVVTGAVEKIRGQLDLIGRPFELSRGKVTFDGGREIDPLLDVALELEANGIRGGIVVEGRASDPELRFVSVPALPEDEVLPRLLFGQSKQSLSGPDAIQLAAGIATLLSGRAGPLDAVRETVGMDVLRVEGTTAEDATVTVGRNVARGVFVGAKQGLGEQGTTVTVEVEVFEGVTVDSDLSHEGGSNIGITYRKDF